MVFHECHWSFGSTSTAWRLVTPAESAAVDASTICLVEWKGTPNRASICTPPSAANELTVNFLDIEYPFPRLSSSPPTVPKPPTRVAVSVVIASSSTTATAPPKSEIICFPSRGSVLTPIVTVVFSARFALSSCFTLLSTTELLNASGSVEGRTGVTVVTKFLCAWNFWGKAFAEPYCFVVSGAPGSVS